MAKARSEDRRERLAEALKENLRRRKARRCAVADAQAPAGEAPDGPTRPNPAAKPQ